jgi:hypothetical protein
VTGDPSGRVAEEAGVLDGKSSRGARGAAKGETGAAGGGANDPASVAGWPLRESNGVLRGAAPPGTVDGREAQSPVDELAWESARPGSSLPRDETGIAPTVTPTLGPTARANELALDGLSVQGDETGAADAVDAMAVLDGGK